MKKRVFSLLLALTLLLCALPLPVHAAANEITVYNWGQYISDGTDESLDVIQAFEEETGIKVNYLTFDSNESMYTKLKTGGTTFDVIIPSDYMIAKLISEDMLEPLDFANIPNYEYIDEAFRDQAYDPQNAYSVPYTWGTVGLIYNKNYVSEEDAQSWSCLWSFPPQRTSRPRRYCSSGRSACAAGRRMRGCWRARYTTPPWSWPGTPYTAPIRPQVCSSRSSATAHCSCSG